MKTAKDIVNQHRRQIELSPGVGEEVQKYALAVCDDILADLPSCSEAERECPKCGEKLK